MLLKQAPFIRKDFLTFTSRDNQVKIAYQMKKDVWIAKIADNFYIGCFWTVQIEQLSV